MLNKLALRNVKRSMRDYLVYLITMIAVAAMMFAFNSLIFSKDFRYVLRSYGTGSDARDGDFFYRAHRGMADQLYGAVHAGKKEQGVRHLSSDRPEGKATVPPLYEGESADRNSGAPSRDRTGNPTAADHHDGILFRVQRGLPSADPDKRLVPVHDSVLLLCLLSVCAETQPENV